MYLLGTNRHDNVRMAIGSKEGVTDGFTSHG